MLRNHSLSGKNSGLENPFSYKHNVHARVGDEYDYKQVDILISKNQVLHILAIYSYTLYNYHLVQYNSVKLKYTSKE